MARRKGKKTECQKMNSLMAKADYINKQEENALKNKKDKKGRD